LDGELVVFESCRSAHDRDVGPMARHARLEVRGIGAMVLRMQ
jgi:hypothetical protein